MNAERLRGITADISCDVCRDLMPLVQDGVDKLMKGQTVFVIAHRLSTVQNSDVMVLDHGRIIERGSHDRLIAERGTYYQLYTGAFELE